MQFLRGSERLLMDLGEKRPELDELADRIVERNLAMIQRYIAQGVDGVFIGDDWGTQTGSLDQPAAVAGVFQAAIRADVPAAQGGRQTHLLS